MRELHVKNNFETFGRQYRKIPLYPHPIREDFSNKKEENKTIDDF